MIRKIGAARTAALDDTPGLSIVGSMVSLSTPPIANGSNDNGPPSPVAHIVSIGRTLAAICTWPRTSAGLLCVPEFKLTGVSNKLREKVMFHGKIEKQVLPAAPAGEASGHECPTRSLG